MKHARLNIKNKLTAALLSLSLALLMLPMLRSCKNDESPVSDVVFRDALGREVGIDKNPERVAALLGSFADVWRLSGGELCAAPEDAEEDFGIDLSHAVNIGGAHSPNVELLLSSDPDLVLASASTASHVALLDTLSAAGITVAYFDVDNFYDYLAMLDLCTDITGRKDLYKAHGSDLAEEIDEIKSLYQEILDSQGEERVLILRAASSFVKAKGSTGTVLGEMLADMGCVNIADNDGTLLDNLSVESVIKNQPHRIFIVIMGNDEAAAMASINNMLKENAAWGTLEAVEEGRIYVMDKSLFNLKPNSRWKDAYELLFEKLTEK